MVVSVPNKMLLSCGVSSRTATQKLSRAECEPWAESHWAGHTLILACTDTGGNTGGRKWIKEASDKQHNCAER